MNKHESIYCKKTALALALAAVFAMQTSVANAADTNPPPIMVKPAIKSPEAKQLLNEEQNKIDQQTQDVMLGIHNALLALQKKDNTKATALLQDVSGKLDILLAKHPGMALLPADIEAEVYDLKADVDQVSEMVSAASKLLDDGKIQGARYILDSLVSEIRISTISIPLGVFPDAIKKAVALSDKGKMDEAAEVLQEALTMLVTDIDIIPLPVLRAEEFLTQASKLEHSSDLSKEQSRDEVLKFTDKAKQQLKIAELLGYGDKKDYKELYDSIDEIKDVIHSEKSAATWEKIKQSLTNFKNKLIHPKS